MGKEIIYKIEYREDDGESKEINLKIDFISNGIIKRYNKLLSEMEFIRALWEKVQGLNAEISAYRLERPEGYSEKIKEIDTEIKLMIKEINSFGSDEHLKERVDLISTILRQNKIENQLLSDVDFWENRVEPSVIIDFLQTAVLKDIDQTRKKKLNFQNTMKTA